MKTAIISDIHGNIFALESVLKDIERENCSKIFCLGDVVMAGPEPRKTLDKIRSMVKSDNFYIIRGNTDRMLSVFSFETYNSITETNAVMGSAYLADSKLLTEDEKDFLKNLPEQKEIEIAKIKILLVHGSPRKDNENIFPDMLLEQVEEIIEGTDADIIFCGHTHEPCGYQTNTEQTVVNVGSVGRPFTKNPDACYVVLNIDENNSTYTIEHKFVEYDIKTASKTVMQRGFEGCDKLAQMLLKPETRYP